MGENRIDSSVKTKLFNKTVAKCPEVKISIEGVPINCLVDTESEVTTVTESFFKELLQAKPKLHEITKWMRIRGNNLDIPVLGLMKVELKAFGKKLSDVGVLVVKDPVEHDGKVRKEKIPGILGSNVFEILNSMSKTEEGSVKDQKLESVIHMIRVHAMLDRQRKAK